MTTKQVEGQKTRGKQHAISENKTQRAGRADGQRAQEKRGVTHSDVAVPAKGVRPVPGDNRSYGSEARSASVEVTRADDGIQDA